MAGRRRGGALDSPDRAVFDHSARLHPLPSAVVAVEHLQCLSTQKWGPRGPGGNSGFRV